MKTKSTILGTLVGAGGMALLVFFLAGCGGKREVTPVAVGEMTEYVDPVLRAHVYHPLEWIPDIDPGRRARFFSGEGVKERFLDPTGSYPDGAAIHVEIRRTRSADSVAKSLLNEMTSIGFVVKDHDSVTVDGLQCARHPYVGNFGGGTMLYGEHIYAPTDTALYEITFAGFGTAFEAHRAVFDTALTGFRFPKPVIPGRDATLPSEMMAQYNSKSVRFSYPDNFNFEQTSDSVVILRGVRQDCSIRLDIFSAQGNTADKVMEQNISKFRRASKGKTTVSGLPAPYFTYAATRQVERRFYFIVKDDKVHRLTLDWYRPQRSEYLAAYGTLLKSLVVK